MGRRFEPRVPADVQVRILGMDAAGRPILETVRTLDLSRSGVVVHGIDRSMKPGEIVVLKVGTKKARYRVIWSGAPGTPSAGRLGLERVDPGDPIWDQPLPSAVPDNYSQPRSGKDRRGHRRYYAAMNVELVAPGASPILATTSDVSLNGCYIRTLIPVASRTRLKMLLWVGEKKLVVDSVVRCCDPGVGIGLSFTSLAPEQAATLQRYLETSPDSTPVPDRRHRSASREQTETPADEAKVKN